MRNANAIALVLFAAFLLFGCASAPSDGTATPIPVIQSPILDATQTPVPTNAPTLTPEPTLIPTPIPSPTPEEQLNETGEERLATLVYEYRDGARTVLRYPPLERDSRLDATAADFACCMAESGQWGSVTPACGKDLDWANGSGLSEVSVVYHYNYDAEKYNYTRRTKEQSEAWVNGSRYIILPEFEAETTNPYSMEMLAGKIVNSSSNTFSGLPIQPSNYETAYIGVGSCQKSHIIHVVEFYAPVQPVETDELDENVIRAGIYAGINEFRRSANKSELAVNAAIEGAAQKHACCLANNYVCGWYTQECTGDKDYLHEIGLANASNLYWYNSTYNYTSIIYYRYDTPDIGSFAKVKNQSGGISPYGNYEKLARYEGTPSKWYSNQYLFGSVLTAQGRNSNENSPLTASYDAKYNETGVGVCRNGHYVHIVQYLVGNVTGVSGQ